MDPDEVDDYYRHVKEPMCLEYVQHKIEHDMYDNNKQFVGDLQQIVDNAREYNSPEDSSGKVFKFGCFGINLEEK